MASVMTVTVDAVNYVFTPESSSKDSATFRVTGGTLSVPRTLEIARVIPKRTKIFPGVARTLVNLHWNHEYGVDPKVVQPVVLKHTTSRRADCASADFLLARKVFYTLLADTELDTFFSDLAI